MKSVFCVLIAASTFATTCSLARPALDQWSNFSTPAGATARLATLARTWGAAKFFHPQLVHAKVDWDAALIRAISRADGAKDADAYVGAVNAMLSELGDPRTKVVVSDQPLRAEMEFRYSNPVELQSGILTIHLMALAASRSTSAAVLSKQMAAANGVIVDLRAGPGAAPSGLYSAGQLFSQIIEASANRAVPVAAMRLRAYFGYPTQRGETTGGYYASLSTQLSPALVGKGSRPPPPIALLVNGFSPGMELAAGLRAAGLARVVQEGDALDSYTTSAEVAPGLTLTLGLAELVDPETAAGFRPDRISKPGHGAESARDLLSSPAPVLPVPKSGSAGYGLLSERDAPYAEMAFPDRSHRLLALFRYWNVIEYFYPYKDLLGSSWEDILPRYIPVFERCKNELEYEMAVRKLSAELHDTHAFVGPTKAFAQYTGMYTLPIALRQVRGEAVVVAVLDKTLPIHVGDAILKIDGKPMKSRQAWLAQYYSASSDQASSAMTSALALRGQRGSEALITARDPSGLVRDIGMARSESISSTELMNARRRSTPPLSVLPGNIAYADLERVQPSEIDGLFKLLHGTKAAIFDLRGYPQGTGWLIASRLGRNAGPAAALYSVPSPDGYSVGAADVSTNQIIQIVPEGTGDRYTGPVVVLIDESTASQGEHTCLLFEAATHVVFVGSRTAGVDGDVTTMVLPGGISASFSGAAVKHADGRQLQRIGITPAISASPTAWGLANGRDEVLEAAVRYLSGRQ